MKLLLTTFLLFSTFCFPQKQYEFDYLIKYEVTYYKDSIKIKNHRIREKDETKEKYYLTNSKKNNYTAVITELDSLNYQMVFKDENGIYSDVMILKSDLKSAEFIKIDCKFVKRYYNPNIYKTKYYEFINLNDTLINGKTYSRYKMQSNNPKRTKRGKLASKFYVINKETSFHLPILNFSTAYEEWKAEGNLPHGIFFEKYIIDYYGHLDSKETLINYWKIDKKILINDECNYTEKK